MHCALSWDKEQQGLISCSWNEEIFQNINKGTHLREEIYWLGRNLIDPWILCETETRRIHKLTRSELRRLAFTWQGGFFRSEIKKVGWKPSLLSWILHLISLAFKLKGFTIEGRAALLLLKFKNQSERAMKN